MNKNQITEKTIVNEENYNEIRRLLIAEDQGALKVGLTILEYADYKKSELYILCLIKETFALPGYKLSLNDLVNTYPALYLHAKESINLNKNEHTKLSYHQLYELSLKRNKPKETKFVIDLFKEELLTFLKNYGFSFLEHLDVEIKPKNKK